MEKETYQRQCKWCAKDFEAERASAEFDTSRCKQAYWRWKHGLQLDVARAKYNLERVVSYAAHEATADEAWSALHSLGEYVEWLMSTDEFGRRKDQK
jgi:hypothetical protein